MDEFSNNVNSATSETSKNEDNEYFRRKYPRKSLFRKVGVLCGGVYIVADTKEIGEGGLAFVSDFVLDLEKVLVINIQIPGGEFVSERAEVRSKTDVNSEGKIEYGISFERIGFSRKRQIRSFVSSR